MSITENVNASMPVGTAFGAYAWIDAICVGLRSLIEEIQNFVNEFFNCLPKNDPQEKSIGPERLAVLALQAPKDQSEEGDSQTDVTTIDDFVTVNFNQKNADNILGWINGHNPLPKDAINKNENPVKHPRNNTRDFKKSEESTIQVQTNHGKIPKPLDSSFDEIDKDIDIISKPRLDFPTTSNRKDSTQQKDVPRSLIALKERFQSLHRKPQEK